MKNWNRVLRSPAFGIGSLAAHCLCGFVANSLLNALKKVCVLRSALLIIFQLALLLCEARALLLRGANLSQATGFAANSALFLVANWSLKFSKSLFLLAAVLRQFLVLCKSLCESLTLGLVEARVVFLAGLINLIKLFSGGGGGCQQCQDKERQTHSSRHLTERRPTSQVR